MNKSVNVKFLTERELVLRSMVAFRLQAVAIERADAKAVRRCQQGWKDCSAEIKVRNRKKRLATADGRDPGLPDGVETPIGLTDIADWGW